MRVCGPRDGGPRIFVYCRASVRECHSSPERPRALAGALTRAMRQRFVGGTAGHARVRPQGSAHGVHGAAVLAAALVAAAEGTAQAPSAWGKLEREESKRAAPVLRQCRSGQRRSREHASGARRRPPGRAASTPPPRAPARVAGLAALIADLLLTSWAFRPSRPTRAAWQASTSSSCLTHPASSCPPCCSSPSRQRCQTWGLNHHPPQGRP